MKLEFKACFFTALGSLILAFGLYNIHAFSGVTEGGVLGLTLLIFRWSGISPAVSGFIINLACYMLGFFVLGKKFIGYSLIAGGSFSVFYAVERVFRQSEAFSKEKAS